MNNACNANNVASLARHQYVAQMTTINTGSTNHGERRNTHDGIHSLDSNVFTCMYVHACRACGSRSIHCQPCCSRRYLVNTGVILCIVGVADALKPYRVLRTIDHRAPFRRQQSAAKEFGSLKTPCSNFARMNATVTTLVTVAPQWISTLL